MFIRFSILLLGTALLACRGNAQLTSQNLPMVPGKGQIRLMLTDFPVSGRDVSQVNVQILRIEVQKQGWSTVIDFGAGGRIFDLLLLQNGNTVELGAFNLAVGNYNQMRMVLGTNNTVLVNEGSGYVTKPLHTPSGQSSGIKLTGGFTVSDQGHTTLLLDFDACQSVKYAGNKYQLNPTIRVLSADTSQNFFSLTPTSIAGATLLPTTPSGVTVNPQLSPNGLMALHSIRTGNGVQLNGNAYVLGSCDASTDKGCLTANKEAALGSGNVLAAANHLRGARIHLGANTQVPGTVGYNTLTQDSGVTIANQVTPPGDVPGLPDFLKGQLGLTNISAANSPLAPGLYFMGEIAASATLNLTGGNYHFDSLNLGNSATLKCLDACIVLVKNKITLGSGATITAANNDPNNFYIFLSGRNGVNDAAHQPTPDVTASPKAAALGATAIIRANLYLPYGTLALGAGSQFTGMTIAHEIDIGDNAIINGRTAQVAFTGSYVAQGMYSGEALQYHFTGSNNSIRYLSSAAPQYIFHGIYQYNIVTKQAFITFDTVDLIDPDCISCQSTGVYPPIASYPASTFAILPAATGFELIGYTNTEVQVKLLNDSSTVTFQRRSGFGPFDE